MNIIQKQPNSNGTYGQVYHSFSGLDQNEYYEITSDIADYYTWNGFIIPTIENGVVTSFICNTTAWETWRSSLPTPQPTQPTETEKLRADVDYLAMETGVSL